MLYTYNMLLEKEHNIKLVNIEFSTVRKLKLAIFKFGDMDKFHLKFL